jgi:hypothetical protein
MIHDKSQEDVKAIIENASKGDFPDGSNEPKLVSESKKIST